MDRNYFILWIHPAELITNPLTKPYGGLYAIFLDLIEEISQEEGTCFTNNAPNVAQSRRPAPARGLDCQCKRAEVMTLQDALVAYQTYARAEGKSPKTVAWITT